MVKNDYVEGVVVSKAGGQVVIPPAAATAFRERYVSLAELAGVVRKGYRVIKRELAAKGVLPAFDPEQVLANFYRRADVESLLCGRTMPRNAGGRPLTN